MAGDNSEESLREKLPGDPVIRAPHFCEFYYQELDRVLMVNIGEKSPVLLAGGRKR